MRDVKYTQVKNEVFASSSDATIVYPEECPPTPSDVRFIETVIENKTNYILQAKEFLLRKLQDNPASFGVSREDVGAVIADSPVDEPTFIFRLGKYWEIYFQEGSFEIAKEFGIIVCFEGEQPISIEDLSKLTAWYDTDTNEWVPL